MVIEMKGAEYNKLSMTILYKNKTAKEQFCSEYKKKWRYPDQVKKKLEAAENFIKNSDSLMDIANYIPFHFERLKGDMKDEWSIRLGNTGYRVTMIPCDDDGNEIVEGDIMAQCKMIKIVKVTEVSNHYE
jgi:plasmid maintenance system killer protein